MNLLKSISTSYYGFTLTKMSEYDVFWIRNLIWNLFWGLIWGLMWELIWELIWELWSPSWKKFRAIKKNSTDVRKLAPPTLLFPMYNNVQGLYFYFKVKVESLSLRHNDCIWTQISTMVKIESENFRSVHESSSVGKEIREKRQR